MLVRSLQSVGEPVMKPLYLITFVVAFCVVIAAAIQTAVHHTGTDRVVAMESMNTRLAALSGPSGGGNKRDR